MDPHTYCHDAYAPYNPAPRNSDLFGYINLALATFNIGLGNVFLRRFETQKKQIEEQQKQIDDLTTALNESREQIQALLDFCFTDRSKWKEGASRSISAEDRCTPDVRRKVHPVPSRMERDAPLMSERKVHPVPSRMK